MSRETKRISLSEKDFQTLVSGGILTKDNILISLQDIGWHVMMDCIDQAYERKKDGQRDLNT